MVETEPAIRAFIAVQISPAARKALAEVIERLGIAVPRGVSWVDPKSVHLTLKFLGDIAPSLTKQILEAARRSGQGTRSFRLHLSGLGMFPNQRQPRVLWAGVGGDLDALSGLQGALESALEELGFPREGRPFSPHLTIGRVRDGVSPGQRRAIAEAVSAAVFEPTELWLVESLDLMRSTLTPHGAVYTSLGSVALVPEEAPYPDPSVGRIPLPSEERGRG